ncbi:MAG TPA: AAA family ATPase, partial [Candidatus Limnocylindrales bacterium]|nr:AAA family ATPase [Candidatus Limnocylindrales bacterium]
MLIELRVADFALIDELKFSFEPGLNVLSGETGAGKSIVIGAINLLLGERAAIEQIRQGQERALIEGIFSSDAVLQSEIDHLLESAGIETGDELIVAREVFRNGRSIARVNGRTVPLSFLKEMGQLLVDLHGQHQHQSLLRPEKHLDLLDASGGEQIANARNRLADLFKRRQDLMRELSELGDDSAERERRLDIYTFQVKEIGDAKLKPGEDAELARREKVLAHAEKICSIASLVYMNIYTGTEDGSVEALIDRIHKTRSLLADAARIDQALTPLVDLLGNTATNLEEVSHELRQYQSELEFDPVELVIIQERLNLINALKRKYG